MPIAPQHLIKSFADGALDSALAQSPAWIHKEFLARQIPVVAAEIGHKQPLAPLSRNGGYARETGPISMLARRCIRGY